MRYAAPGDTLYFSAAAATGLVGMIGVRVLDAATGGVVSPRTTGGITEVPAGSGEYVAAVEAPDTRGFYRAIIDDGSGGFTSTDFEVTYTPTSPAPTDAFATADELAARLGLTFTDDEAARADTLLRLASGLIEAEVEQSVALVTDDVITIRGTTDERIKLPQRPVVSISSIALDGTPLTTGSWYLDGNEIVRRPFSALDADDGFLLGTGFGWPGKDLTITYTHGYAEPPPVCKATCLEMVVRVWANPNAVVSESIAGVQSTYTMRGFRGSSGTGGVGLLVTAAESDALKQVFGRRARSVTILGGP